jgi:tetratricopeptide (TPR) repeat protein
MRQTIATIAAIVITVLLFLAPRIPSDKAPSPELNQDKNVLLDELSKSLDKNQQTQWKKLSDALTKANQEPALSVAADELRNFWSKLKSPLGIAFTDEVLAQKQNDGNSWMKAGDSFYRAAQFAPAEYRTMIFVQAINCYKRSLEKDPSLKRAQVQLASCYVEGSSDPMKGIKLLDSLITKDSTFIEAQLQLGFFSLQSGQYPKALNRFGKVLRIDSMYYDAYVYLGQTYEMMNDKVHAVENYEKYASLVTDSLVKSEVINHIKELKK